MGTACRAPPAGCARGERLHSAQGQAEDRLDKGYERYCLRDPHFYDSPTLAREDCPDFAIAGRSVPEGWERSEFGDWLVYRPTDVTLPLQGWKIHASGCLENAETIIAAVWDYCLPRRIPFKFVRAEQLLLLRNAKSADRWASGKLVTIYPADDAQLEVVLGELGAVLEGQPGPLLERLALVPGTGGRGFRSGGHDSPGLLARVGRRLRQVRLSWAQSCAIEAEMPARWGESGCLVSHLR